MECSRQYVVLCYRLADPEDLLFLAVSEPDVLYIRVPFWVPNIVRHPYKNNPERHLNVENYPDTQTSGHRCGDWIGEEPRVPHERGEGVSQFGVQGLQVWG